MFQFLYSAPVSQTFLFDFSLSHQTKLEQLNQIVWPEIWEMTEKRIREAHSEGYTVCVIDAAVMLKAGWKKHMHELWVTIAPEKDVSCRLEYVAQLWLICHKDVNKLLTIFCCLYTPLSFEYAHLFKIGGGGVLK